MSRKPRTMTVERTIATPAPAGAAFDYLADFTHSQEWDPATVSTERIEGAGAVGTRYRNVSRFAGRRVTLVYTLVEISRPHRLVLRAERPGFVAVDSMSVEPLAGQPGCELTYRAEFTFTGALRWVVPLFAPAYGRLGDRAAQGLRHALANLPSDPRD